MDVLIEALGKAHRRDAFSCGEPSLDDFLRTKAGQFDRRRIGRTFVAVAPEDQEHRVLGFFTLATSRIDFASMPGSTRLPPALPVPTLLLGRLGVDTSAQGMGLGRVLMLEALKRATAVSRLSGLYALEVQALHPKARNFYEQYGFEPLLDDPLHLYLAMETVERLVLEASTSA